MGRGKACRKAVRPARAAGNDGFKLLHAEHAQQAVLQPCVILKIARPHHGQFHTVPRQAFSDSSPPDTGRHVLPTITQSAKVRQVLDFNRLRGNNGPDNLKARPFMPDILNLDPELAAKADALFQELGLDLPTAVRLFLLQSLREGGLPFTPRLTAPSGTREKHAATPLPQEERRREENSSAATGIKGEARLDADIPSVPAAEENLHSLPETDEEAMKDIPVDAEEDGFSEEEEKLPADGNTGEAPSPAAENDAPFSPGGSDELRRAFASAHLIGAPLRRIRSLNRLYAIGERNPHVQGWREVYVSGDEPFALDFGAVRVELGFHGGGSLRMMDGRLPDKVLEADAVYPRDLSAVFSSVIGQPLADVSSTRTWDDGQEREQLRLHFANGCTLTFAPGKDWGALWLSDAHGSVMFAPDAVWLRVLDDRAWNGLR